MVAIAAIVDAFLVQTRLMPLTFALCGGRISVGRPRTQNANDPNGWVMPTYAVVYLMVSGPSMRRPGRVPFRSQNVQVECYGPDLRTAGELYRTWYSEFYPSDNHVAQGFIAAHCAVASLEEMSSPIALFGGENIWPKIVSTHMVKYFETPV